MSIQNSIKLYDLATQSVSSAEFFTSHIFQKGRCYSEKKNYRSTSHSKIKTLTLFYIRKRIIMSKKCQRCSYGMQSIVDDFLSENCMLFCLLIQQSAHKVHVYYTKIYGKPSISLGIQDYN